MGGLSAVTLAVNGLSLILAIAFILLLLWYDPRKRIVQFFAVFVGFIMLWNVGSMFVQAMFVIGANAAFFNLGVGLLELGFSGATIALYAFTMVLVGLYRSGFRLIAFLSIAALVGFRVVTILSMAQAQVDINTLETYRFDGLPIVFFMIFDVLTLAVLWFHRRKLSSRAILFGIPLFVMGQGIAFLNPDLPIVALSTNISSAATLMISLAIVHQEIIRPIRDLNAQVTTLHDVTNAISSRLNPELVLSEISQRAAAWLAADAVVIFLRRGQSLNLAHQYNLPNTLLNLPVQVGQGIVGETVQNQRSVLLENYGRDWTGDDNIPYARETFGSVMCVPLLYNKDAIGVLMVIAGKHGRLFRREDLSVVELLAAQAAVTISHSRLFDDVEAARHQLETLLVSTENPVVAIDNQNTLIFANPAAMHIPSLAQAIATGTVSEMLQTAPTLSGSLTHELFLDGRTYLCHIATLGGHVGSSSALRGIVAVMNDISELKELDRMKSEMVRLASHDLKNPLMGAMLHLDLLEDSANQEQAALIGVVNQQLDRMQRIIGGVLDLERLKDPSTTQELIDVNGVVDDVVRDLRRYADQKRLVLEATVPDDTLYVLGDVRQIERALANLVENAIKFTDDGGRVHITLARGKDDTAQIEVHDSGIGIPESLQPMVFERFFRGQQRGAEHVTGSGLGLSFVKTIIENHRGRVWLKSAEGQGSQFYVTLPLVRSTDCSVKQEEL